MPIIMGQTASVINAFVSGCRPIRHRSHAPRETLRAAVDKLELSNETRARCNKFLSELDNMKAIKKSNDLSFTKEYKTTIKKKSKKLKIDLCNLIAKAIKGPSFIEQRRNNQSAAELVNQKMREGLIALGKKFNISSSPVNQRASSLVIHREHDFHWYKDAAYSQGSFSPSPLPTSAAKNSRSSFWGR